MYSFVGETLAQEHRIQQIEQLLDCINSSGLRDARGWDEILNACINVLAKDKREVHCLCSSPLLAFGGIGIAILYICRLKPLRNLLIV